MKNAATRALKAIESEGALLVFPIKNAKAPHSLWSALHPRSQMRWEWDENGDGKVFALWQLREELSRSGKVVYAKWYQGRASFFSTEVFVHLLAFLRTEDPLPQESRQILEVLEMDSPQSPKQIKEAVALQGKWLESAYNRSMKALWNRLLIVGYGEIDDSSFPSLAVGATQNLFEELWLASQSVSGQKAAAFLLHKLGPENKFLKFAQKIRQTSGPK